MTTGEVLGNDTSILMTSEVIDLSDPNNNCTMLPRQQTYPIKVMKATGQLIDGQFPYICGGHGFETINTFRYTGHHTELSKIEKIIDSNRSQGNEFNENFDQY